MKCNLIMQFNTLYFILFFLPLTISGYYLAGSRSHMAADWLLIGASMIFYGFTNVWYPVMLGILILLNWSLTFLIRRAGARSGRSRARTWMVCGIVLNAAFLGIFKYTDFFLENLNILFRQNLVTVNLILPLGISFIIFSQISWIVDAYRGETDSVCFREYVLYSSFFPKLSQGPITLMRDFLPQMRREERFRFCCDDMVIGIQMFVCGLGKKVLIADVLGVGVEWYFDTIVYRSRLDSLIVMLVYTFQIYMDFSGYSDMALGVSRMLGFHLPANFNSPYKACTVTDFWRRWHISLTTFLREYIYFPLGGSRRGKVRTYLNILIVYLVSGLWHGASWSYVLWGLFHGLAQIAERLTGRLYRRVWKPLRWLVTFCFVNLMWMLFCCGSWSGFTRYWWHLTSPYNIWAPSLDFMENFRIAGVAGVLSFLGLPASQSAAGAVSLVLLLALCFFLCLCCPNNQERRYRNTVVSVLFIAGLLTFCLLSMSEVSTFIYNDF